MSGSRGQDHAPYAAQTSMASPLNEPESGGQVGGPLTGLRVFDLTHAGVGPWASMLMAAMGAIVVKI